MLSQKARYALRAVLHLARQSREEPTLIGEIAEEQQLPKKFLELILLDLKRRGIVHSVRGRKGGYVLGRDPSEISFAEVIRVIDGPLALAPCASRANYRKCDDCLDERTCPIRRALIEARDATAAVLEGITLEDALTDRTKTPAFV
jgi:Rrf2 family protein